jgi:hypothetical protein
MISGSRRSGAFEDYVVPTEGRDVLHARLMRPRSRDVAERLVFISPLVGAGASQALVLFRSLTRRGATLMSFEYRGHFRSSGTFHLDSTIVDTRYALEWACGYARRCGLPLHGFATCYGAVPLAAQFARGSRGFPLWSFSTISGLFALDQIIRFEDFVPILSRRVGAPLDGTALLEEVASRRLDVNGDAFRSALREYLKGLFPELRVGRDYFEELQYARADVAQSVLQLARARYFDELAVPPAIPCRFFFGRNDDALGLRTRERREAYRSHILSLIPHAEIREMEFDHFGRGPDHEAVLEQLADFFEESERRAVSEENVGQISPVQGARA